jgi:hypothetical protein
MKIIAMFLIGTTFSLCAKTLFLSESDTGEIYIKSGFITSLTFDVPVQTVFLGDTENFMIEISGDKKTLGIWSVGGSKKSNLVIISDRQYNFLLLKSKKSPLFYSVKPKAPFKKSEIVRKTIIKDKDLIEDLAKEKRAEGVKLKFKDKEYFKDTLLVNIRVKVIYPGKESLKIIPDKIILSQSNQIMPIQYKYFNKETKTISITAERKKVKDKIRVQIPFEKGKDICQSEIFI